MEAFATLSIVCNLLQLTSYGIKIATVSREIYEGGISSKNEWILNNTIEMGDITRQLDERLVRFDKSKSRTPEQEEMMSVAQMCKETSYELQEEIAKLRLDPKKSDWRKALLKSISTLKSQKVIDELESRLRKQSELLQTRLLTDLRLQQQASELQMRDDFTKLDRDIQHVVTDLAAGHTKLVELLAGLNADLVTLVKTEGNEIRQDVKSHMDSIQSKVERKRRQESLMDSLLFTEINDRMNSVPKSHEKTFQWIFERDIESSWSSFETWLRQGEQTYWISGKPGSGKSVLMKFIVNNAMTSKLLDDWGQGKPVIEISFFIWKGGAQLQRQKRGLLCSLTLQLMRRSQAFLSMALSTVNLSLKNGPADWSVEELSDLLAEFARMQLAKVCVFVDGLDESEPTDGDVGMLDLVGWLEKLDGWKVCVASRPEPDFQAVLSTHPKLRLQDLTHDDLKQYTIDKLQEIDLNELLDDQDEQLVPDRLINLICEKAEGVFLWVRFAVSLVIRGVRRMDGWDDLAKRLTKLPSELEQLYFDMWRRSDEDQEHYRAEAVRYFNMVLSAKHNFLSCFDIMVSDSKNARSLLNDAHITPSLKQLLRDCQRTERRIVSCSRGLLESQTYQGGTPSSRSHAVKMSLVEDETPTQIRAFRWTRIGFVHRTAIDFLETTTVGQNLLKDGDNDNLDLDTIRKEALLVAPYCEFPIVDLFDFRRLFFRICNEETLTEDKVKAVQKFELVHKKILKNNNCPDDTDMARNWVDAMVAGKWRPYESIDDLEDFHTMSPFQYAIGWTFYAAKAGVLPYFQQLLSQVSSSGLNPQYLSCLAICAADNYHIHGEGFKHESLQLELMKLVYDLGADLNLRYPVTFGRSPLVDPLTRFCMFHNRTFLPSADERAHLLSRLKALLNCRIDLSSTSVHVIHTDFIKRGRYSGEANVSIHSANRTSFAIRQVEDFIFVVELNLPALLRFFTQSLGTPPTEVTSLLEDCPAPRCKLLALRKGKSNEMRECVAPDTDSENFYDHFDRSASFGQIARQINLRDRELGIEERQAYASFIRAAEDIYDRGIETDYETLMTERGYWTAEPVMPADIPFLRPFDPGNADCSRLMFP